MQHADRSRFDLTSCLYFPICKMGALVAASQRAVALVDDMHGPPSTVPGPSEMVASLITGAGVGPA